MTSILVTLAFIAIAIIIIKYGCIHKWKLSDYFYSGKRHTMVYTCNKCKKIKTVKFPKNGDDYPTNSHKRILPY